ARVLSSFPTRRSSDLWPEVQRVAGESLIFEGTEGLPTQIAQHLQSRQLSVTLSEQFTGGLLALQLTRAGAPLLASEVVPFQQERSEEHTSELQSREKL